MKISFSYGQTHFVRYFLVAIFFVLTFRTFQAYPGMGIVKELWIVFTVLFLIFPYFIWKTKTHLRFNSFELYVLSVIIIIPILSAFSAWREFGQPLFLGILSQRTSILSAGALMLIFAYRRNLITLVDIRAALVFLAWSTLILYLFMTIFLDPKKFSTFGLGFVSGGNRSDFAFKFRTEFIIFGFFYYAFIGWRHKSRINWLLALSFFLFLIIVEGGRTMTLSILGAFLLLIFRWGSITRFTTFAPKLAIIALLMVSILYMMNSEKVTVLAEKFVDAFVVVVKGEESNDASANARLIETAIAMPYIYKNWALGNGDISNRWKDGYEGVLAGYFYPSDIGILGVIYMYGVMGLLLFLWQFFFAVKFSSRETDNPLNSPLLDAVKGYLLYFTIHSLSTGRFAHYSAISFMFIALLYCISFEKRRKNQKLGTTSMVGEKI